MPELRLANRSVARNSSSTVLSSLAAAGSVANFRAMSPLPEDAQRLVDDAVLRVGRDRLQFVADLISEGLTRPLPNWLSVTELAQDKTNDVGHAQRTMELDVRGERQVQDRLRYTIPVFATHDDFSFGGRELAVAARVGTPLDTSHVEQATRNCNFSVEDQAINGIDFNVFGNSAPGLLDSANTYTYTGTGHEAWDHASKTSKEIQTDVLNMIQAAKNAHYFGPYNLYYPNNYWSTLQGKYIEGTTILDQTVLEALQKIQAGGRPLNIRELDRLPDDRVVLVTMTTNVIDLVDGQRPATISWEDNNGLGRRNFMVLACQIVRCKTDYDGNSGIVVGNVP